MRLPLFPLHAVLFPHLPLPLRIFEERYRALTRDVLAEGSPFAGQFVVSMITEGPEVAPTGTDTGIPTRARQIGTIAEVRTAEQFPDGRWALLAVGVSRAALGEVNRGGVYPVVDAERLPELTGAGAGALVRQVQSALDRYLSTVKRYAASAASRGNDDRTANDVTASLDAVLKPIHLPEDPLAASYAVGGILQVELIRKQQLLELPDAASRLQMELDLLRRESSLLADGAMPPVPPADLRYHPN
jgi:Lon protease-like protein